MGENKAQTRSRIFLVLRLAFVVCGLAWAVIWLTRQQRWHDFKNVLLQMNPVAFIASLVLFIISMFIVALRWWLLLKTQAIFIPYRAAVKLYFLGWFYNNFMPSSVGGDLVRIYYVAKHTHKKFEAGLSVLVDRAVGLLSTLIIAAFFYFLFLRGKGRVLPIERQTGGHLLDSVSRHSPVIFWSLAAAGLILAVIACSSGGRKVLRKIVSFFYAHGRTSITKSIKAARLYCAGPLALLEAFGLTVFLQLMVITGFWIVGKSMGIHAHAAYYYTFFTIVWVLAAVPVSIGGAVVAEVSIVQLFATFAGVAPEAALAVALTQRIVWMLASIPGAVIHISGAHLPEDFSHD